MAVKITIYTDGSALGNPGKGGYGVVLQSGQHYKELSAGYRLTTNNRMEMTAVLRALEALKEPCRVVLCSDSKYVIDALSKGWAKKWRANGWKRGDKKPALNPDLWEQLLNACERHEIEYQWIKGHAGHPENERCDELAVEQAARFR